MPTALPRGNYRLWPGPPEEPPVLAGKGHPLHLQNSVHQHVEARPEDRGVVYSGTLQPMYTSLPARAGGNPGFLPGGSRASMARSQLTDPGHVFPVQGAYRPEDGHGIPIRLSCPKPATHRAQDKGRPLPATRLQDTINRDPGHQSHPSVPRGSLSPHRPCLLQHRSQCGQGLLLGAEMPASP